MKSYEVQTPITYIITDRELASISLTYLKLIIDGNEIE